MRQETVSFFIALEHSTIFQYNQTNNPEKRLRRRMKKYYYALAQCLHNHYVSQNPVVYEKEDLKDKTQPYRKLCMGCTSVKDGTCKYSSEECKVYQVAPETIPLEREWQLYKEKL